MLAKKIASALSAVERRASPFSHCSSPHGASLFRLGDIIKIALFQEAYSEREGALFVFFEGKEPTSKASGIKLCKWAEGEGERIDLLLNAFFMTRILLFG